MIRVNRLRNLLPSAHKSSYSLDDAGGLKHQGGKQIDLEIHF